ncbi:hypothetical protein VTN77DRAFT_1827 [Rasamsonia byssochlamydoides]|uniref:uncharacterized protein n=1 Tax=Rasamsonia byssochlamydoides TaxID=89139 RepID=UPI00374350C7
MAATTSKPEMPAFSYAQAAKGLSTASASQQPAKSSTEQTAREESSNSSAAGGSANPASTQNEAPREGDKGELGADPESKSATTGSSKNVVSGTSSPSIGTASTSTLPKEDDISTIPNGTSDTTSTWDKQSQASVPTEKPNAAGEAKKEESSNSSSEKAAPPKELKAAPIPAVNVWQQRKEAQEAKAKANAAALKSAAANASKLAPAKPATAGPQAPGDSQDASKAGAKKKMADGQPEGKDRRKGDAAKAREDGSRKSGGRFTRPNEESAEATLPPVGDAAAWPTPQTAQGEEKRRAQEKSEKSEKSPVIRAHGKEKWTPVPYVPTAVFNTPLPSAARRGGRPSRGGRDGGRGGAHNTSTNNGADNKAASGQTAQAPATNKQASLPDRGRNESHPQRANSLPAQARRPTSVDTGAQNDQRRPSQAPDRSRGDTRAKAPEDSHAPANGPQTAGGDAGVKPHRETRYSGKNQESAPTHKGGDHNSRSGNAPADGHGGARFNSNHERRFDNPPRSADFPRDSSGWVPRDRDHRDFTKDRGEYQRDREHPRERGDSRPERGRGGYRGRGGHSYGGSQNPHFSHSQLSQNSFIPPKSFSQRSQQQGYQNGSQPHNSNHRLSLRSPSLPNSAAFYGVYPMPDMTAMYAYPPMHPGPMTAIPYQPYMEPFSLIGMIQMQLEYYFSVDNLCKDLYLRKHMDSQGFVLLSFIANFKRIKNLTEDFDLLRHCCRQLRNAEYQLGGDGVDRLRPREKWEQWVLSMEQRDPSAQNEGPPPPKTHSTDTEKHDDNVANSTSLPNGSVQDASQTSANALPNGTAEHHVPRTSLSSTAPEFTPFVPAGVQNESANVGNPNDHNLFPDDQVENLVIVVPGGTVTSDDNAIPSTNGGTSANSLSAEENRLQQNNELPKSIRNGNEVLEPRSRVPAFWIKQKDNPAEIPSSDLVHVSYSAFRKRALEKHDATATNDGEHDMDVLYRFWSHFLVDNFNAKMYDEFKNLALDDHRKGGATTGFNCLLQFYDSMLFSSRVIPDQVAKDLVDLVEAEPRDNGRPFFHELRLAWCNGAFNLNSRKKIDQIISKNLKAELEG